MTPLLLGMEIGRSQCSVVLGLSPSAGEIQVLGRGAFPRSDAAQPDSALARLGELADGLVGKAQGRLSGVGVALDHAVVSSKNGDGRREHASRWECALDQHVRRRFDRPTLVQRTVEAGALAESSWGAGRVLRDFLFVAADEALDAVLVLGGRVRGGRTSVEATEPIGEYPNGPSEDGDGCDARSTAGDASALARFAERVSVVAGVVRPQRIVLGGRFAGELWGLLDVRFPPRASPGAPASLAVVHSELGPQMGDLAPLALAREATGGRTLRDILGEATETLWALRGVERDLEAAARVVVDCLRAGRKVLVCGNGGSAAQAHHFVAELVGRYRQRRDPLPALCLAADTSVVSCIGNDFGWEHSFARPLQALGRSGDVLVCLSTSGESANVIRAMEEARARQIPCVALLGAGGGRARALATCAVVVPTRDTARIQEAQLLMLHWLCDRVEESLSSGGA